MATQAASSASRDEFSQPTKESLARRAGYRCSICQQPTVGPHKEPTHSVFVGEACHIYSAAANGPRANAALATEERSSISNGIHLCKNHARLIDVDIASFPAEKLSQIKNEHEASIRALIAGRPIEFNPSFLNSHETQVIHGRGTPTLGDLWVDRHVVHTEVGRTALRREAMSLTSTESGVLLICGDQTSGRTSLLKRMASQAIDRLNCIWLDGGDLTESVIRDPVQALGNGYRVLNAAHDGWHMFLEAEPARNAIFLDDIHLSPLNTATKRKVLNLLQGLARLVVVTANEPFVLELLAVSCNDGLKVTAWRLADLCRAECAELAERWCKYGSESTPDHALDRQVAVAQESLEIVLGRRLMPRFPIVVLTALQLYDAGTPIDTSVGSFGGVYETVIHLAICRNARNQAEISSERTYLEELAYWLESHAGCTERQEFNQVFAALKAIGPARVVDIEMALGNKGFLSRKHAGFRFNYQKHYFLASFIRNNPNRRGVEGYVGTLIANCWKEEHANTALFLAYLQPSSFLLDALLLEVQRLFAEYGEFDIAKWEISTPFPKGFFHDLTLTTDPEANRRALAKQLDTTTPIEPAECDNSVSTSERCEDDAMFLDFLKAFHLIKLIGQLIRNSPIALDADQKFKLVSAGLSLSARLVGFIFDMWDPSAFQTEALNAVREQVLRKSDRANIEAALTGIIYNFHVFLAFTPLRHACFYLAHPDLTLTYEQVFSGTNDRRPTLTYEVLSCGLDLERRSPDTRSLRKTYEKLSTAGQDMMHLWAWFFLSFNRVPVPKRQAILECLGMKANAQLLLPSRLE